MANVSKVKFEGNIKDTVFKAVGEIGGFGKFIDVGDIVLLKPNFNTADPFPASTDLGFLKSVIELVYEAGAKIVLLGDSSTITVNTRKAMEKLGVFDLEKMATPPRIYVFEEGFFGKKFRLNLNSNTPFYRESEMKFDVEYFEFDLPPGSSNIVEHHFPDKGFKKGSEVGDLLIKINILPHKQFYLDGTNVVSRIPCSLSMLIKGGILDVATMYGIKELKIPPGTPPGNSLTIPNCGVSESNFHIVILELSFPTIDQLKSEEEWREFGIHWELM